jgi:hypothetical protein
MQSVVDIRQNKDIVDFFARLWSVLDDKFVSSDGTKGYNPNKDIVMSSDGISVYLVSVFSKSGFYKPMKNWLHSDKAGNDKCPSVQTFLHLTPQDPDGACLHILEGSHACRTQFGREFPHSMDSRFYLLKNQEEVDFFVLKNKCRSVYINAKPGDIVCWSSSVIHQGKPANQTTSEKDSKRCVVYMATQPRRFASPKDLENKRKAWEQLRCTTHNAAHGVKLFAPFHRTWGKPRMVNLLTERPVISELGKSIWALH